MAHSSSTPNPHSQAHLNEAREYWWNEDYLELLAQRLELHECRTLADIGCGQGSMALRLARYLPEGAAVTGVDIERVYVKKAAQLARKNKRLQHVNFEFQQGSAYQIPLADASQEVTVCQTLLIHMEDPKAVLEEMMRVTKPGGLIMAMEPNNLVSNLMLDKYSETDLNIPAMLEALEVRLRIEQGKKVLGEGFNSLGDVLPDLFQQVGLGEPDVWLSDKATPLIPPYDTREKRVRAAQLIDWLENNLGGYNFQDNFRYYKAGGGKKATFESYWQQVEMAKFTMLKQLKEQQYYSSGGNMMYIVVGYKPEES